MQINKVSMPLQGIRRASIFAKVTAVFVFIAIATFNLILYALNYKYMVQNCTRGPTAQKSKLFENNKNHALTSLQCWHSVC